MKPEIGLLDKNRDAVVKILNTTLADEMVLLVKTRNYHWNVTGPQFNDLHKFLDGQYGELNGMVDEIAERARTLGGMAMGTMGEFQKQSRLKEHPGQHPSSKSMLSNLLNDQESIIRTLRADIGITQDTHGDAGTADFLTGLLEQHEKMAWMLRSFLE
jgi:starvation-inducible DNA-binding protein